LERVISLLLCQQPGEIQKIKVSTPLIAHSQSNGILNQLDCCYLSLAPKPAREICSIYVKIGESHTAARVRAQAASDPSVPRNA
jgi:hypothetical protein